MRLERNAGEVMLTLSLKELKLLRRALERASFIDTPQTEQEEIVSFCSQALDQIAEGDRKAG